MKFIATLTLLFALCTSCFAENKIKLGSLPMKSCSAFLCEEYMSKARLGQKVMVVSDYSDVFSFKDGQVTKVLHIDGEYSVFVRSGSEYFVYNGLKGVGVDEGDRLEKGDFLGELRYNSRYNEHQLEMQVWRDNGRNTYRCSNNEVMCILSGTKYVAPRKVTPAKHKVGRHKKAVAKHGKASRNKRAVASRSKSSKKKIAAKKTSSKSKKTTAAKKKAPVKKAPAKKRRK